MEELTDATLIEVRNLMGCTVGFKDEDTRRRIVFNPYEVKKLPYDMLRRLNYSHGGNKLLNEYLCVKNAKVAREFGVTQDLLEHEYNWTEKDVLKLLATGSLDELRDALDFAPEGIRTMIVDKAVETKVNSVAKRQIIQEKTGMDINAKIRLQEELAAAEKKEGKEEVPITPTARRADKKETENVGRRTK